jgi:hypothetical protein
MEAVLPPSLQQIEERVRVLETIIADVEQGGIAPHSMQRRAFLKKLQDVLCFCFKRRNGRRNKTT